ncbi:MAG: DUF2971 domain-containing protein [Paludibacter sp.]
MEKELVYKFRDCENEFHRRMLLENEIYFASPRSFNDPFDCHIDYNFSNLTYAEREDYINDQILFLKEESLLDVDLTEEGARKKLEDIFRDPIKLHSMQDEYNKENFDTLNKNIGVFSCCQSTVSDKGWQNILLWSHYANGHKGFCVGFNKEKLCNMFTRGEIVESDYPKLKPIVALRRDIDEMMTSFRTEISHKSKVWAYEKEFRFVKINTANSFEIGLTYKDRTVKLPLGIIEEVTMGLETDEWQKNAIKNICRSKGIKLFQAEKKQFEFSITRKEIDLN